MIEMDITRRLTGADGEFDLKFETYIQKGQLVTLYGPSGAGKSSVLRMLAGLMAPHGGSITVDGEIWYGHTQKINSPTQSRNIGMVFQDYSLFPNMTVRGNLEFALQKGQSKEVLEELLALTELENLHNKKPHLLSGGQKQRVALARALIRKPKILLLDEPLSALDSAMRSKLQDYILNFHRRFDLTTVLVSHDYPEIVKLSKRVLIMEGGKIRKDGPPEAVFSLEF